MPNDVSVEITERTFSEDEGERLVLSGLVHSGSPQTFDIILLEFHFESSFEFDEETNKYFSFFYKLNEKVMERVPSCQWRDILSLRT